MPYTALPTLYITRPLPDHANLMHTRMQEQLSQADSCPDYPSQHQGLLHLRRKLPAHSDLLCPL